MAEGDKEGPRPEEPEQPTELRAVVGDVTAERLKGLLSVNAKGLIRENDELTGLVMSMNAYRSGKGTDRQLYLSGWNGRLETTDRVKDKADGTGGTRNHVTCLSVLGGLTPDNLFLFKGEVRKGRPIEDGFYDRFLFSFPTAPDDAPENWECVDPRTADGWAGIIRRLRDLEPRQETYPDGSVMYKPEMLRLTACGRAAWQAFTATHAAEKNAADFPDHLKGIWAKLKGYCPRLALVVHCLRRASGELDNDGAGVDAESIRRAVRLVDYFKSHARKVGAAIDLDPRVSDAKVVLAWLRKYVRFLAAEKKKPADRFQVRDAFEGVKGTLETMDRLNQALDVLEHHGHIRSVARPHQGGRGRPRSPWYLINPDLGTDSQNSQNVEPDDPDDDAPTPPAPSENSANCANRTDSRNGRPSAGPVRGGGVFANCANHNPGESGQPSGADLDCERVLVTDGGGLDAVRVGLERAQGERVYLDTETTGLSPRSDRVRLLSLSLPAGDGRRVVYLIDCFTVDPSPLWVPLAGRTVVGHHLAFDLAFLARLGFTPGPVLDTLLLSQVLHARAHVAGVVPTKHTLLECAERELGLMLNKDLQASDWAGHLTDAQLEYAAADVAVLGALARALEAKVAAAGLDRAADIEMAALPAVVWMAGAGVPCDAACWRGLAATAAEDAGRALAALEATAPAPPGGLYAAGGWNWDSPKQVGEALALAGCPVDSTRDAVLAGLGHPLADLVRDYRDARKRQTTYGAAWLKHVTVDGRVYPRWVQLGANSGRMSCAGPNMQNLPRGEYRRCFAAPPGRVLVKADYFQIELRIAAKVSGDPALLAAYHQGEDLHALTARQVLGVADVTKQDRQLAKALNFGLLYGMGAKGFRDYGKAKYGLDLTEAQAGGYRAAFFRAYPGLRGWHRSVRDGAVDTRTLAGRRVLGVTRFNEKLNLPVQGTGADGLKAALALLWERRAECPDAVPVLAVHDEVVVECDEAHAAPTADWLKRCLMEAMAPLIAPVPAEVEVTVGATWAGDRT